MRHIADFQGNQKPNARVNRRLPAKLVDVLLNNKLGWGEKDQPLRTSKPCIDLRGRQF